MRTRVRTALAPPLSTAAVLAGRGHQATSGTGTGAAPTWAPADSAAIHPGVQMYTDGAQCTANFVFTDGAANVYVGLRRALRGHGRGHRHQRLRRRVAAAGHQGRVRRGRQPRRLRHVGRHRHAGLQLAG